MLVLKVTFRGNSLKEFAKHYLTDLGQNGIFVRTQSPLPVGTKLRFELRLENDIPLLFGQGIVLWVSEENRELQIPCGMELRFDSLSPESESHFQWLQLEKRGVTVGTEVPLYIATSTTASDPAGSAGNDSDRDAGRSQRGHGTGTLQGMKAPDELPAEASRPARAGPLPVAVHVERAPTGPERAHVERAPTGPERAFEETVPTESASLAEDGRSTLPYLRGPDVAQPEPGSRLPVLVRKPRADQGLTGYRPAESLSPGDSDPGKIFNQVAPRDSQTGRRLDGVVGRDTLLTIHELAGRRLRLGVVVLVGVGLLALLGWWWLMRPPTRPTGPGQNLGSRLLRVSSDPAGAEVLVEGKPAGRTPLEVRAGGEPMLQLQRAGYQSEVVKVSNLDPRWHTERGIQVLEVKVTLARAAPSVPDASLDRAGAPAIDAAPGRRRRRPAPKRALTPDEPRTAPTPDSKTPEPEAKKPEPEVKKPEPEVKKPEPEEKKPAVKTPDWAGKPEGKPAKQEKKVKAPGWAD